MPKRWRIRYLPAIAGGTVVFSVDWTGIAPPDAVEMLLAVADAYREAMHEQFLNPIKALKTLGEIDE